MGASVCFGGLIGAGKTTFMDSVADYASGQGLQVRVMGEMYTDQVRWRVENELPAGDAFIFAHRLQMALDGPDICRLYDLVLMERSFIDHLAFVDAFAECGLLPRSVAEWSYRVVDEVKPPAPDKFVFLKVPPELACARREERDSSGGNVFSTEFMQALDTAYDTLVSRYYTDPIVLDWTEFDAGHDMDRFLERIVGVAAAPWGKARAVEFPL